MLPSCACGPSAYARIGTDGVSTGVDFVRSQRPEASDRASFVNTQNIELNRLK
jgi:hypothetical protein